MKLNYILVLILTTINLGLAQNKTIKETETSENKQEIRVLSRVQKNKVLLRWAVTDALAWKKLNKYGYLIERFTIARNNKTLSSPEKVILAKQYTPEPLASWETIIETNENAAIIAQALYGEEFSVTGTDNLQSIVNLSEETEQRFTFALYTADKDFEIAKKAGLGFEDTNIKENEKYLYRVSSNVPNEALKIKYGGVFVNPKEWEALPKPMDFTAHFTDNSTMLSWNFNILAHAYGSYYIERSLDKKTFERITQKPYTSLNQENTNNNRIFYVDSMQTIGSTVIVFKGFLFLEN